MFMNVRDLNNFYRKKVLPRLINASMKDEELNRDRAAVVQQAVGTVLEIGVGSGLNFPFYPPTIKKLYAVDPSKELWLLAQSRLKGLAFPVEFIQASAEKIPLLNASVDCVIATWTFCSIPNPSIALSEVRRVLKPRGLFLFVEHGRSCEAKVAAWQRRLDPIWTLVSGGCHLSRRIDEELLVQGFEMDQLQQGYWSGRHRRSKLFTYFYSGIAKKKC